MKVDFDKYWNMESVDERVKLLKLQSRRQFELGEVENGFYTNTYAFHFYLQQIKELVELFLSQKIHNDDFFYVYRLYSCTEHQYIEGDVIRQKIKKSLPFIKGEKIHLLDIFSRTYPCKLRTKKHWDSHIEGYKAIYLTEFQRLIDEIKTGNIDPNQILDMFEEMDDRVKKYSLSDYLNNCLNAFMLLCCQNLPVETRCFLAEDYLLSRREKNLFFELFIFDLFNDLMIEDEIKLLDDLYQIVMENQTKADKRFVAWLFNLTSCAKDDVVFNFFCQLSQSRNRIKGLSFEYESMSIESFLSEFKKIAKEENVWDKILIVKFFEERLPLLFMKEGVQENDSHQLCRLLKANLKVKWNQTLNVDESELNTLWKIANESKSEEALTLFLTFIEKRLFEIDNQIRHFEKDTMSTKKLWLYFDDITAIKQTIDDKKVIHRLTLVQQKIVDMLLQVAFTVSECAASAEASKYFEEISLIALIKKLKEREVFEKYKPAFKAIPRKYLVALSYFYADLNAKLYSHVTGIGLRAEKGRLKSAISPLENMIFSFQRTFDFFQNEFELPDYTSLKQKGGFETVEDVMNALFEMDYINFENEATFRRQLNTFFLLVEYYHAN